MRILSGIKCSGKPHIGNYFGAIRQFIDMQNRGDEGFYFIANLHSLDQIRNAAEMRELSIRVALDYLALGLDPKKAVLFMQSDIPEIPELTWILGSVTPMGLLQKGHSYKDALAKGENVDWGRFSYPVLMAADILLYHSDLVPVGKDQKQHIEFTRDIAIKFNTTYCKGFDPQTHKGGVLKVPDGFYHESDAVVPGADGRKMSKSYGNAIEMFAPDKEVKKSIMGVVTDSTPVEAPKDPAKCNVFALLKLFCSPEEMKTIEDQYRKGGVGYGDFKKKLLEKFHEKFDPARKKHAELSANLDYVHGVLKDGASRARSIGTRVLDDVRSACGLNYTKR
ncbi:MAG: tryptophan--tRNA ligase [Planctomycetes bacterium]|nr:tryptophan--tRNA ligase [Planctomycetota bacterium]